MDIGLRLEQDLELAVARAAGPIVRRFCRGAALCGVSRRCADPAASDAGGGQRLRPNATATKTQRRPSRPHPQSSFCIALRSSMTTFPASTIRRCGAASPPSMRLWRADRGADRRCADRAGLRVAGGAAPPERLAPLTAHHRLLRGRAIRHLRRPGMGMRAIDRHRALPARQDRRPVRRLHHGGCRVLGL